MNKVYCIKRKTSDVHVIQTEDNCLECFCIANKRRKPYLTKYRGMMIRHLKEHIKFGDQVPAKPIRLLERERRMYGNRM